MTAPPKYTKVASEDPAEQETEFEEVDSGSASPTPATSEPTPNETASVAVEEVVVPLRNASASDVRAYIVHLLVTKHGVISEAAHAVAAKWMLGRGFDFLEASSEEFDDIFGRDLGRHIYRSTVHDELLRWHTRQIQEGFMYCQLTTWLFALLTFLHATMSSSSLDTLRSFAWTPTILAAPYLFYRTHAPVHLRGRFKAGIYLIWLAGLLWIAYIVQLLKGG